MDVLTHALRYLDASISVIPIRRGGTKAPVLKSWAPYQERLAAPVEARSWWGGSVPPGIAAIGGAISGGLELIDFDKDADETFHAWWAMVEEMAPGLYDRLTVIKTPRRPAGYHVWFRCGNMETPGNSKLAQISREEQAAEKAAALAEGRKAELTLIETRGEGGYALVPGSPSECHENLAPYEVFSGSPLWEVAEVSIDERDLLIAMARSLDRNVIAEPTPKTQPGGPDLRPGDDYDRHGDWAELLGPHGWEAVSGGSTGERRWRRPGKSIGWSATTGHCTGKDGTDLLRVFSTNAAPLEEGKAYGKFRAYALLNADGDLSQAASLLRREGYGGPSGHKPAKYYQANGTGQQATTGGPASSPEHYQHNQLLDAKFPPQRWLIDSFVPAGGFVILGGKKKLGKSWFCLQVALAVAKGSKTLGRVAQQGRVVYLCLEDGARRLQDRLCKQKSPRDLPIDWFTSFPKLDAGGLTELDRLLQARPALAIIDTLAAAKTGRVDENASGPMADLTNALRNLAQQYNVAALVTHHHGKFSYGDPGDDLRGSSAIAAAADMNLGLYKVDDGFRLRGEGRDVEPFDYAVTFDPHGSWDWGLIGDARLIASEDADVRVLMVLSNLGECVASAVASALGVTENKVRDRLNRLANERKVLTRAGLAPKRGNPPIYYRLPPADSDLTP